MKHLSKLAAFFVAMVVVVGFASCKGDVVEVEKKVEVDKTYAKPVVYTVTEGTEGSKKVTLSTETQGAAIYYTTDGSIPTSQSTAYKSETVITVTKDTTFKAIAIKDGIEPSPVATALVTVTVTVTNTVTETEYVDKTYASPVTFVATEKEEGSGVVTVTMSTTTEGAEIRYTTDGSNPTDESALYETEI